jgi:hypothetical protein
MQDIQSVKWIFACILMPLLGLVFALRMILLSLLPTGLRDNIRNQPADTLVK